MSEGGSNPLLNPNEESFVQPSVTLRALFEELVSRNFRTPLRITDAEIIAYVAELLADFSRAENLYRVRDSRGKRLEDVGEMLVASNPLLDAPSFDREREIRKHIGDFTLFFAGLFPEAINQWRLRRQRLDSLVDYVKAGKESYHIVAAFDQFEYRSDARFFEKLSDRFESCVFGLNLVKQDLSRMQQQAFLRAQQLIES
ncbi:MAG: hypothetical protein A3H27_08080 [Acidobacteria bacterium RIFCSPLOWO2_02_FULL_59_13]|nr:MAG: hypothetical protein A3H27_08080 [Acidobacteria bacterium RIFCSPLOWO2_02_FULL_59_13]